MNPKNDRHENKAQAGINFGTSKNGRGSFGVHNPELNRRSPAQRSVRAGAQKVNSYQSLASQGISERLSLPAAAAAAQAGRIHSTVARAKEPQRREDHSAAKPQLRPNWA